LIAYTRDRGPFHANQRPSVDAATRRARNARRTSARIRGAL
jgi:hypothetical protein